MRLEVNSAADFLMNLLRVKKANNLSDNQLQNFKGSLEDLLLVRYRSHWYPDVPTKGSGFRCIRINGKMDPIIEQAAVAVGLHPRVLRKILPQELTMWIDPDEVSYRIGENGSICVLYDTAQNRASPASDLDSTGSGAASEESLNDRVTTRLDISDIGIMELLNTSSSSSTTTTFVTRHTINNHHSSSNNNSGNSPSSGHLSPPLSPPYMLQQNRFINNNNNHHHHYHHHQQQQQQQQQQHNNNTSNNNNHHHSHNHNRVLNNYVENQLYHWDGGFNNNYNKVRTQC